MAYAGNATSCPVLLDADGLFIISKPEGVLSHPNPESKLHAARACAFSGSYDFENRCFGTDEGPVWLLHRLDQDTSGILMAARNPPLSERMRKLFEENRVAKTYVALVMGGVRPARGAWRDYVATQKNRQQVRSRILPGRAPNAELRYKVLRAFPGMRLTLLEIELITGRTHQIRVQSAYRGHPVVGDEIYGHFPFNKKLRRELGLKRMFLHASRIQFQHPETGKAIALEAPLPEPLQDLVRHLA